MKGLKTIPKNSTLLNIATGYLTLITQIATSFFLSSFIVANIGEAANGFTQLANNFVTYASLLTLAFNSMGARFISVAFHQGDSKRVNEYYSTLIVCNAIAVLVLMPLAVIVTLNLGSILDLGNVDLLDAQILFACVFMNFFVNLLTSILFTSTFVTNMMSIQNLINLLRVVLNAVLLICVFCVCEARVYYVSLVALLLSIAMLPVAFFVKKRLLPEIEFSINRFSLERTKELFSSGIWNTVNQCGNLLMTGFDLLLANWFVGAAAMGVLSVAKLVPTALINLANTLNQNVEPGLVTTYSTKGEAGLMKDLERDIRISNVLVSVPMAVFASFSVPFYSLWMPELNPNVLAALSVLSMLAFVFWSGPQVLYNVYTVTNHLKVNTITYIIAGLINCAVVYLLLSCTDLGIFAIAGVSSAITILRCLVVTAPYVAYLLNQPWYLFFPDVGRSVISFGMAFAFGMLVQRIICPTSWITLIFGAAVSTIVTGALLLSFTLSKEERTQLLSKFKVSRKGEQ